MIVDGTRWIVHESTGRLDAELLRDRPVEERGRRDFVLTWAVPVDDAGAPVAMPPSVPAVVHAPTPTDEPLTLPALLIAPLPLDPTRRHVAPGPLRDALLDHAAAAYADLVRGLPPTPDVLALVPVSVAAGAIDGELRARILPLLRDVPFIATAEAEIRMRPANAVMLDDAGLASDESLGDVLVQVLPELVPASVGASCADRADRIGRAAHSTRGVDRRAGDGRPRTGVVALAVRRACRRWSIDRPARRPAGTARIRRCRAVGARVVDAGGVRRPHGARATHHPPRRGPSVAACGWAPSMPNRGRSCVTITCERRWRTPTTPNSPPTSPTPSSPSWPPRICRRVTSRGWPSWRCRPTTASST